MNPGRNAISASIRIDHDVPRGDHPDGDAREMPVDLGAVAADDARIDAIAAGVDGGTEAMFHLLSRWRREVRAGSW